MKRFTVLSMLVALVSALAAAPTTAAPNPADVPQVVSVDVSRRPEIGVTMSVPGVDAESLKAGQVKLAEDGKAIPVKVRPIGEVGLNVAVVLDTSDSMKGERLLGAIAAAQGFIDQLPAGSWITVVGFADKPQILVPSTSDREAAKAALDQVHTKLGTALYDAVISASQLLAVESTRRPVMVLLTDGDDSGSKATAAEAADAVKAAQVPFIGIALGQDQKSELGPLTDAVDGQLLNASSPDELADLYSSVAKSLSSLVELRYQSSAVGIAHLSVKIGDLPTATRDVRLSGTIDPVVTKIEVLGSGVSPLLNIPWLPWIAAILMCSGVIGCIILVQGTSRREELEEMLDRFESVQVPQNWTEAEDEFKSKTVIVGDLAGGLTNAASKLLEKQGSTQKIDGALEQAGISMRAGEMVAFTVTSSLAGLVVGFLIGGSTMAIFLGVAPYLLFPMAIKFLQGRRRKKFADQLCDTLMLISGALKAGYGLGQAIDSVAAESPKPTNEEFSRVLLETRLGMSLEDSLDSVGDRMECEDFYWVINAVKINATVGGDLSGLLDQVGETIRARLKIRRQVDALAAEGKISALVLFVLPPALVGFISAANPQYIAPMFKTGTGHAMLGASLTLMLLGGAWLKKIVSPEF